MESCGVVKLCLADLGGEGWKWTGMSGSGVGSWQGISLLRCGEYHTTPMSAVVICDRDGGFSGCRIGISSTSMMEAPTGDSRRQSTPSRHQVVRPRWSQGGRRWKVSFLVETTQGLIVFSVLLLGSFVRFYRAMLLYRLYVNYCM
jgi:hypothetical protein